LPWPTISGDTRVFRGLPWLAIFMSVLVIAISSPLKAEGKVRLGEVLAIICPDIGLAPKGRNVKNSRIEGVRFLRFHHANLNFEIGWFARLG
jgi:hypothetical protein